MSVLIQVEVGSDEFARVLNNTLAFLPARSRVKQAQIQLTGPYIFVTTTCSYTVGTDYCPVADFFIEEITRYLDRDAFVELEKAVRADKKSRATLEFHDDHLWYFPGHAEQEPTVLPLATCTEPKVWPAVAELLARLDDGAPSLPQTVAFDPALLMRFSKVKADKDERVADLLITAPDLPILVKIGPTFTGCIMPIDRDDHAKKQGDDGLWT